MNSPLLPPTSPRLPSPLLTTERVRGLLTAADPDYGRNFTDAQWRQIAERLSALARLIWRISERRAGEEPRHSGSTDDPDRSRA